MDLYGIKLTELSARAISFRPEMSYPPPQRKDDAPKPRKKKKLINSEVYWYLCRISFDSGVGMPIFLFAIARATTLIISIMGIVDDRITLSKKCAILKYAKAFSFTHRRA